MARAQAGPHPPGRRTLRPVPVLVALLLVVAVSACGPSPSTIEADAVRIAANQRHGCAVQRDGSVGCWGDNRFGQLGDGSTDSSGSELRPVLGVEGARRIAAGVDFSCAIAAGAEVRCWGFNLVGQAGNQQTLGLAAALDAVPDLPPALDVAAGKDHACAVGADGLVRCWGANDLGQLGDGTRQQRLRPVAVRGIDDARQVAAGAGFTCALDRHGDVRCWGSNAFGQLGDGTRSDRVEPGPPSLTGVERLAAGLARTCAVRDDGSVWCWGAAGGASVEVAAAYDATPTRVPGVVDAIDVAVGETHACATAADGTVCWSGASDAERVGDAASGVGEMTVETLRWCVIVASGDVACQVLP